MPELPVGDEAGEAVTPPCNDTGATEEQPSEPFPVLRIDGVDPSVAVATEAVGADGYWVWFTGGEPSSMDLPPEIQKYVPSS